MSRPRVWLSTHALERAAERVDVVDLAELVAVEVAEAIEAGRVACRKPRAHAVSARFAWTEGLERVFVIRHARSKRGERGILVLTVFTPLGVDEWLPGLEGDAA